MEGAVCAIHFTTPFPTWPRWQQPTATATWGGVSARYLEGERPGSCYPSHWWMCDGTSVLIQTVQEQDSLSARQGRYMPGPVPALMQACRGGLGCLLRSWAVPQHRTGRGGTPSGSLSTVPVSCLCIHMERYLWKATLTSLAQPGGCWARACAHTPVQTHAGPGKYTDLLEVWC